MVKLYSELEDYYSKLFENHFIAKEGFYLKFKSKDYEGTVTKGDGKPLLEFKFDHKYEINDIKIKKTFTLRSSGEHTIDGKADISKVIDKSALTHSFNFNSATHDFDALFSFHNKSIKKMYSRWDFHYFKGGEWTFTPNVSRQLCKKIAIGWDFTFNGAKNELTSMNLALMFRPNKWVRAVLARNIAGSINKNTDWLRTGLVTFKSRSKLDKNTKIGFDYIYNLETKAAALELGLKTHPAEGFMVKSRINSGGDAEVAAKLKIADKWHLLVATAFNAGEVTGKQQPHIGVGLEGKLD